MGDYKAQTKFTITPGQTQDEKAKAEKPVAKKKAPTKKKAPSKKDD